MINKYVRSFLNDVLVSAYNKNEAIFFIVHGLNSSAVLAKAEPLWSKS